MTNKKEEIIKTVSNMKPITEEKKYYYSLVHTYDNNPKTILITNNISPIAFELLIAHIQYKADSIQEGFDFYTSEIRDIINNNFESESVEHMPSNDPIYIMDLYVIWEKWVAYSKEIESLTPFQDDNLAKSINTLVTSQC